MAMSGSLQPESAIRPAPAVRTVAPPTSAGIGPNASAIRPLPAERTAAPSDTRPG